MKKIFSIVAIVSGSILAISSFIYLLNGILNWTWLSLLTGAFWMPAFLIALSSFAIGVSLIVLGKGGMKGSLFGWLLFVMFVSSLLFSLSLFSVGTAIYSNVRSGDFLQLMGVLVFGLLCLFGWYKLSISNKRGDSN